MSVSQYLPPGCLLDSVKSCFNPDVVKGISSLIGASESSTQEALNTSAATVLGGIADMGVLQRRRNLPRRRDL